MRWLKKILSPSHKAHPKMGRSPIVCFLDLAQDLDILLPILERMRLEGWNFELWSTYWLFSRSQRTKEILAEKNITTILFDKERLRSGDVPQLGNRQLFISIVPSSLRPHGAAYQLSKQAERESIPSVSFQHGLENICLNYFDNEHSNNIEIASNYIFTWGDKNTISNEAKTDIRERCIPVGCPKKFPDLETCDIKNSKTVAVFENLHWSRYNDHLRETFVRDLESAALARPELQFIVKPHHTGQWLSQRFKGDKPKAKNLIIANPNEPKWQMKTAPDIIRDSCAVITTPSTVALDAACMGQVCAITTYNINSIVYQPLNEIKSIDHWLSFIDQAIDTNRRSQLIELSKDFRERTLIPGDACSRTLLELKKIIKSSSGNHKNHV